MLCYSYSKQLLNGLKRKIKGFIKTLFLDLLKNKLAITAVFLLVFVSAGSCFIIRSLTDKNDSCLVFKESAKDNLFISSANMFLPESPEFLLIDSSILKFSSPPVTFSPQVLGSLVSGYEQEDIKMVIIEYIVETGDTLSSLATKFNISTETILWANDLSKNSTLKVGQKLIVLPVSGIIYHVKNKDTLSNIAEIYKGKAEEIIAFNNLSENGRIYVGDILIIPNGKMPTPTVQKQQISTSVPLASSYFIAPVSSPYIITQWLHWYNAIDFSYSGNACGKPILASAGGTILKVGITNSTSRSAFGGAGNHISILHPNGIVTTYGHISVSLVKSGETVKQGQIIALMGGQPGTPGAGLSTGCHVHFSVTGAKNPFAK